MNEKKYSKVLTVILIIIIIAIIALFAYLGYTYYKNNKIQNDASDFVSTFSDTLGDSDETDEDTNSDGNTLVDDETISTSSSKKTTYKGFEVLGTIEIPETDVSYPILAKLSAKALDTAVVAAYPSSAELNTVGNVVIMGHNYRNGTFFSDNGKLSEGDKIYITDLDGDRLKYTIYDTFTASETDTSFYNRDTDGAIEVTLSTCTDDSSARIIILARVEDSEEE